MYMLMDILYNFDELFKDLFKIVENFISYYMQTL